MKALTVKQPWADAIVHGGKDTENRTWPVPPQALSTRILIHAGKGYDPMGRFIITDREALNSWPGVHGAVIAVATLADCHQAANDCCHPWGEPNVFHWQLTDIVPLPAPLPCTGAQRLWTAPDSIAHTATSTYTSA